MKSYIHVLHIGDICIYPDNDEHLWKYLWSNWVISSNPKHSKYALCSFEDLATGTTGFFDDRKYELIQLAATGVIEK